MGYYDELDHEIDQEMGWAKGKKKKPTASRGPDYWHALLKTAKATSSPVWRFIGKILRCFSKIAFFPIISPLGYAKRFDVNGDMVVVKRSLTWRICDGILTRALLTPLILALFMSAMVWFSTHPKTVQAVATPDSFGLYYQRVNLLSLDNQHLTAWYIPPINADQVAYDPTGTLLQKWPAAVVCHGLGASHDQYLPLADRLHSAGFAVLLLDLRGQGESDAAAVTYGLRERMDVLAGVKYLREINYVDADKVCVIGHDIGAIAALQAASLDSSISAVVADGLWLKFEDRAREVFSQPPHATGAWASSGGRLPTQWLAPLYTLTFEIAVRDRMNQMDPATVVRSIHTQPLLFITRNGPDYTPVQDVLTLASTAGGPHDVIIDNANTTEQDTDRRVVAFLIKSTGWKGPNLQLPEALQEMLKNQVSKPKH